MHQTDRCYWVVTGLLLALSGAGVYLAQRVPERRPPTAPPGIDRPLSAPSPRPSGFSPAAARRRQQIYAQVSGDEAFERLGEPEPGDWLWSFREPGQTLDDYADEVVNRKLAGRETLHLLPFTDLEPRQQRIVAPVREHTALFFDTKVELLPARGLEQRWYVRARGQYSADAIVAHLARTVPASSLGLFGLMGSDLYSGELNFVFGLALLERRAGIYSLHRFRTPPALLLRRALALSAHEIGHIFGLRHCVFYRCLMNGVNSLAEGDRSPLHLCPVCLAKLQWNLRFDVVERERRLAAFYRRVGLDEEARFAGARARELSAGGKRPRAAQ